MKGGKILGQYPDDLSSEGPQILQRGKLNEYLELWYYHCILLLMVSVFIFVVLGRIIPTTPWEAVFRGIASWVGASEDKLDEVCPNLHKFNSSHLIDVDEIYGSIEVPPTPNPTQAPSSVASDVPSAFPTFQTSETPSEKPSSIHSALPTSIPSETHSQVPSGSPTIIASYTPSELPSELPSKYTSVAPTLLQSQIPSTFGNCPVNAVLGSTFRFVLDNSMCLRVGVFKNGKIEADYSDTSCSNEVFNPMGELSLFDSIDENNNIVTFVEGDQNYYGTLQFRLSPDVTETQLKIISWNPTIKQFAAELAVSSCSSTKAPSAVPSMMPSNLVCRIDQVWGETFYFAVGVNCYRLEISENGKLEVDGTDSTCSNPVFTPQSQISAFGSANTDTNEVSFVAETAQQYSGTVRFRQFSNLAKPQVNILSLSDANKQFVAEVEIPSCDNA